MDAFFFYSTTVYNWKPNLCPHYQAALSSHTNNDAALLPFVVLGFSKLTDAITTQCTAILPQAYRMTGPSTRGWSEQCCLYPITHKLQCNKTKQGHALVCVPCCRKKTSCIICHLVYFPYGKRHGHVWKTTLLHKQNDKASGVRICITSLNRRVYYEARLIAS